MKKKYVLLLLTMLMALFSVLAFAACGETELEKLDSPTDLRVASTLGKFRWSEVKNASGYQVEIEGEIHNVSTNVYDFAEITTPGIYTFRVLAKGDGETYEDSDWSWINYRVEEGATPGLRYTHILNAYLVSCGKSEITGRLVIPRDYNGYPVVGILNDGFRDCTGITEVAIPNSIKTIYSGAFAGCTGLTSVAIPDSVTTIDVEAFYGCENLEEFRFPKGEVEFGRNALAGTAWMENQPDGLVFVNTQLITYKGEVPGILDNIPDTTTYIASYAFEAMTDLKKVVIPKSVKRVALAAFISTGLQEVTFSPAMTEIEMGVFAFCKDLKTIEIPENIKTIGNQAFSNSGLEYIKFNEGLQKIDVMAFIDCTSLTIVEFPDSLTEIGDSAFENCTGLEATTFRVGLTTLGKDCFLDCTNLVNVIYVGTYAQWRRIKFGSGWDGYNYINIFDMSKSGVYGRAYTLSCIDKTVEIEGGNKIRDYGT